MRKRRNRIPIVPESLLKIIGRTSKSYTQKAGLPPGSIVYTGQQKDGLTELTLLKYDANKVFHKKSDKLQEIVTEIDDKQVNWINFNSLHDTDLIASAGELFSIHNLTLEDIVHVGHQPKLEEYDDYLFFTLKMIKPEQGDAEFNVEHVSFVLRPGLLISFQEQDGDPFDGIRERIEAGKGKARGRGADYLLFLLIDAIIDQYLLSIETITKEITDLELEIFENPDDHVVEKIIGQKKVISSLRKIIYPVRDNLKEITSSDIGFIDEDYYNYYMDVYDHLKNIVDHLDSQREMLTSLMEFYMSQISNQMNKVMQRLTIVATIFIPLTFLAGIYGMNFQFMPELQWKYSYPLLLLIMLVLGVIMYFYMRRKKWF